MKMITNHITAKHKTVCQFIGAKLTTTKRALIDRKEGMGTIEVVLILAVLVGLALLFKDYAAKTFKSLSSSLGLENDNNSLIDVTDIGNK